MRGAILFLFVVFAFSFASVSASADERMLTVDLAQDSVDISTGFNGAYLSLFGQKTRSGQVAVVIKGPVKDVLVRKKSSFFNVWMNRQSVEYKNVPQYYDFAISDAEENILNPDARKEQGIGFASLKFTADDDKLSEDDRKAFAQALVRNKQAAGLFPVNAKGIVFLSDTFFKTEFYVPSNVPTGEYVIETFLINGTKVIDKHTTNVRVAQVGFSSSVYQFAHSFSLTYGVMIVFIAVLAGWLSNAVRQKK